MTIRASGNQWYSNAGAGVRVVLIYERPFNSIMDNEEKPGRVTVVEMM